LSFRVLLTLTSPASIKWQRISYSSAIDVICPNYHGSLLLLLPDGWWAQLVAPIQKSLCLWRKCKPFGNVYVARKVSGARRTRLPEMPPDSS